LEMQPFELTPLLSELEKMFERMLPENIRLEMEIAAAPAPCRIVGDATRIQQALVNLALNARDAMPNGGTLHVDMSHVPGQVENLSDAAKHDNWVRIRVSDTGIGIHPEALPRIFEPFFTTKEPGKGTGLGLAQVYGIVQQHSGHITVDSETGRGTAFSIFLPALPPPSEERIRSANEEPDLAQGDDQTILLVEDNPDARESMGELLDLLNYHVLTAANGREALAILEEGATQVDLILSDLVMPEMGGLELCRELRRKKIGVKIIILTGYASDESLAGLQDLSISDYLHKPVDLERLSRSIEGVLSKRTPSS
jgi:CheY-like chemotaxis protein